MSNAQELRKAAGTLRSLALAASGQDWKLAVIEEPEDTIIVGIETEDDEMVMGDCMNSSENWVTEEDAHFCVAADPGTSLLLADLLDTVALVADAMTWPTDVVQRSMAVAQRINRKYPKGVKP